MDITWRVFTREGEGRNSGEKVQGGRSIIGRHKTDKKRSKMVWETENSKNICITPGHELRVGNGRGLWGAGGRGDKGEKNGKTVIA